MCKNLTLSPLRGSSPADGNFMKIQQQYYDNLIKTSVWSSPATIGGLVGMYDDVFDPRNSNLALPGPENLAKHPKSIK